METTENTRYSFIVKAIRANVDDKVLCDIFNITSDELVKYKTIIEIIDDKTNDYMSFINFLIGNVETIKKVKKQEHQRKVGTVHWKKLLEQENMTKVLAIAKSHYENNDVLTAKQLASISNLSYKAIRSYIKKSPELSKYVRTYITMDSSMIKEGASIIE